MLLAASGSEASRHATSVAADLASTFDARLVILHVVPPVEYRVGRLVPTLPIIRQLEDPLTSPVLLEARRVAWGRGASAGSILVAGDPARVIVVAGDLGADLLVIGSTPRGTSSKHNLESDTVKPSVRMLLRATTSAVARSINPEATRSRGVW